jgi:hypothetical protein
VGSARAYGLVSSAGALDATIRKGSVTVSNPLAGTICLTLPRPAPTPSTPRRSSRS